ncbi:hypothetical protein CSKR_203441 [Clonorchis sinensis]|uniref:Uncharacterized protein n=1 Tax=Clonorchis sinensis TaxID=79923 RepID=A0A8T1MBE8_CLOSI|nr:hypothetical protein CSKR_203441 [Clonorchis sinensis]
MADQSRKQGSEDGKPAHLTGSGLSLSQLPIASDRKFSHRLNNVQRILKPPRVFPHLTTKREHSKHMIKGPHADEETYDKCFSMLTYMFPSLYGIIVRKKQIFWLTDDSTIT